MKLLRFVWQTAARFLFLAILTSFVGGLSNAALVALISHQFTVNVMPSNRFIALLAGFVVIVFLLDLTSKQLLNRLLLGVVYDLNRTLVAQILATPFARLEKIGTPRLMALLTDDINHIALVMSTLPSLSLAFSTTLGCVIYLAWLSPLALLVLGLVAIPIFLLYFFLQKQAVQFWRVGLQERNQLFAHYHSLIEGIKELTLHARRRQLFVQQLLQPSISNSKEAMRAANSRHYIAQSINQLTYFVSVVVLLAAMRRFAVPVSVLAAYALVILYLRNATMSIVSTLPQWTESNAAIEQIESLGFSLSNGEATTAWGETTASVQDWPKAPNKLALRQVVHQYYTEESAFQLGPLDLCFDPAAGEIVFITGGNGSGKTTLMKLIVGLYRPQSGQIEWNGEPIGPENLESYRQNFTVIFAQPYLFTQLIGLEQVDLDNQARDYLAQLELSNKVRVDQGKLSTIELSTGQQKRLALLTAYLEDRPVYFFDEWAASQDPSYKEIFYRQILPALKAKGKLIIVISHDDHYYDVADRIIKLDYGQIDEDRLI